jgi:hypothetical protein
MTFDTPQWVKQRQVKTEELSPGVVKVSGPNLPGAVVGIRLADALKWQAFLRSEADGPDLEATNGEFAAPRDAMFAAFELYRNRFVV